MFILEFLCLPMFASVHRNAGERVEEAKDPVRAGEGSQAQGESPEDPRRIP